MRCLEMVDFDLGVAQRSLRILIVHRASLDTITEARDAIDDLLEERTDLLRESAHQRV